jgi:hypothetical protein
MSLKIQPRVSASLHLLQHNFDSSPKRSDLGGPMGAHDASRLRTFGFYARIVASGAIPLANQLKIALPVVLSWELLGGRVVTPLTATALTFRPAESDDFEDRGSPPPTAAVQLRHFDLLRMLNVALYFRAVTGRAAWRVCRGMGCACSALLSSSTARTAACFAPSSQYFRRFVLPAAQTMSVY